jgi:D-arabinose 1-dehydrogenase-like Zn-dependent alcohol dehydrogenase
MKALVLRAPCSAFELTTVPDPVAGPGEAVARVIACGAGLTIQHIKAGRIAARFPRIIGHEITGEIVEVGSGVTNVALGDAVTAYYYLYCGACRYCLANLEPLCVRSGGNVGKECDGGYAEYVKLPAHNFIQLPAALDHRNHAAEIGVVTDALATPYKVLRRASVRAGETVAIFGAGGGLGLHQILLSKWARTRVIAIDVRREKLGACEDAGADHVIDASSVDVVQALLDVTSGEGVDVAIDYVSTTGTLEAAARALARRGRLVTLGGAGESFCVSSLDMLLKEQILLGSRYVSRIEVLETLEMVARGDVWPIVTDIREMAEAEALHARIEAGEIAGRAALMIC